MKMNTALITTHRNEPLINTNQLLPPSDKGKLRSLWITFISYYFLTTYKKDQQPPLKKKTYSEYKVWFNFDIKVQT